MDNVKIESRGGGAVENGRYPADDDKMHIVFGEDAQNLEKIKSWRRSHAYSG